MACYHVGVIGGGISGLSCASRLQELGVAVSLYDTGVRGPGGRASSRLWKGFVVDHAAQFAEARTPEFMQYMESLENEGKVKRLAGMGSLLKPGVVEPMSDAVPRFVGIKGMGSIPDAAVGYLDDVRPDVWVSPNGGIRKGSDGAWLVKESRHSEARYDAVVIAHNGKCAERLTSRVPARSTHMLLRAKFGARLGAGGSGNGRMTLNSIYSLLFEVPKGTMPSELGACQFVSPSCEPDLRLLSNNGAKYDGVAVGAADAQTEVWTALSSGPFGAKHKAPQEHIEGTEVEEKVTALLLDATCRAVGLPEGSLASQVTASKLQLWGAAQPLNVWTGGAYTWDSEHTIGIAGDWFDQSLSSAPPSSGASAGNSAATAAPSTIESAWLSGRKLAEHIADEARRSHEYGLTLGREGGAFVGTDGGGFGPASDEKAPVSSWVTPPRKDGSADGRRSSGGSEGSAGGGGGGGRGVVRTEGLFVRNLSYGSTEEELSAHLETVTGPQSVVSTSLLRDEQGKPRGLARVRMRSADEAAKACEALNGQPLAGRSLTIEADERQGARGRGGVGRGRGRGRGAGRGRRAAAVP